MTTLYGLPNCDTCRKARAWLDTQGIAYSFHDVRADGLDRALLDHLAAALGWENLLNRRSTTWRGLSEAERADLDHDKALNLILAYPALLKRPVLIAGDSVLIGFTPAHYLKAL